jgi:hypothetical protein
MDLRLGRGEARDARHAVEVGVLASQHDQAVILHEGPSEGIALRAIGGGIGKMGGDQ